MHENQFHKYNYAMYIAIHYNTSPCTLYKNFRSNRFAQKLLWVKIFGTKIIRWRKRITVMRKDKVCIKFIGENFKTAPLELISGPLKRTILHLLRYTLHCTNYIRRKCRIVFLCVSSLPCSCTILNTFLQVINSHKKDLPLKRHKSVWPFSLLDMVLCHFCCIVMEECSETGQSPAPLSRLGKWEWCCKK